MPLPKDVSNRSDFNDISFVDVAGGMVEILFAEATHKYLGRVLSGSPGARGQTELKNRFSQAWAKYSKHRGTLINKLVPVKLRLRLFDATVSPTVLYGLSVLPLTRAQLDKLDALQRRMLRNIVGWVRVDEEPWRDTMARMNARVARALEQHTVECWSSRLLRRQWRLGLQIAQMGPRSWPLRVIKWQPSVVVDPAAGPVAHRNRGRPPTRWDDRLQHFSDVQSRVPGRPWYEVALADAGMWKTVTTQFVDYVRGIAD